MARGRTPAARRAAAAIAVAALGLAGPALAAADLDARLFLDAPLRMRGGMVFEAPGAVLVAEDTGAELLRVRAREALVRVVDVRVTTLEAERGKAAMLAPESTQHTFLLRDAELVVRPLAGKVPLVALAATGDAPLRWRAEPWEGTLAPSQEPAWVRIGTFNNSARYLWVRELPAGTFALRGAGWEAQVPGHADLALHEVALEASWPGGRRVWELQEHREPLATPLVGDHAHRNHTRFAVVRMQDGVAAVPEGAPATVHASRIEAALEGSLAAPRARGVVATGAGPVVRVDDAMVEMAGSLRLEASSRKVAGAGLGSEPSWTTDLRATGRLDRAAVGGRALELPEPAPVEAAGLAALLAALAAWLTGAGPKALALVAVRSGLAGPAADALDHPRRRAVYEAVRANPGIHLREVQRITGLRWGALQYHAFALQAMGRLREVRVRKYRALLCDAHPYTSQEVEALHLLRMERARRIAESLLELGGTQAELARRAGVEPRLAHYHLASMVRLGLAAADAGRPRRYLAAPRLAALLRPLSAAAASPTAPRWPAADAAPSPMRPAALAAAPEPLAPGAAAAGGQRLPLETVDLQPP